MYSSGRRYCQSDARAHRFVSRVVGGIQKMKTMENGAEPLVLAVLWEELAQNYDGQLLRTAFEVRLP